MMHKWSVFSFSLVLLVFFSCKKETGEPVDMGYNYFPLEKLNYSIYQVDSIVWDDYDNSIDSFSYMVKLMIDSSFIDNAGRTAYWQKKYVKNDQERWDFVSNYSVVMSDSRLEVLQENNRYIKLVFPAVSGGTWNSNALNSERETKAIYLDTDYSYNLAGQTYDSCLLVNYEDEINLIQEFVHDEIYARNIGMIYKRKVHKQELSTGTRGYTVEYRLENYGRE